MIRTFFLALLIATTPTVAFAHKLTVFASVDCEAVTVEAKFSNGRMAKQGDVRVLDGENNLLQTLELGADGTARVALDEVEHSSGLVIEVDTGGHENYWIVTPEDIGSKCGS